MYGQMDHETALRMRQAVEQRAYEIWGQRCTDAGKIIHGSDKQDWAEAEEELMAKLGNALDNITPSEVINSMRPSQSILAETPEAEDEIARTARRMTAHIN